MPAPAALPSPTHDPKRGSIRALRALNFFGADVLNGMGPYTSGYVPASQLVFTAMVAASSKLAGKLGRKLLFLLGFAALAVRGVRGTLSHHPAALIAVQRLDGLGADIFGVAGVLIIAALTKGTGRFNAAQGAIATAQGLGAFLSNSVAGYLAKSRGYDFTFLVLAGIVAVGLGFLWWLIPETRQAAADVPAAA